MIALAREIEHEPHPFLSLDAAGREQAVLAAGLRRKARGEPPTNKVLAFDLGASKGTIGKIVQALRDRGACPWPLLQGVHGNRVPLRRHKDGTLTGTRGRRGRVYTPPRADTLDAWRAAAWLWLEPVETPPPSRGDDAAVVEAVGKYLAEGRSLRKRRREWYVTTRA